MVIPTMLEIIQMLCWSEKIILVLKLNLGKKDKHPIKRNGCFDNKTSF